MKKITVLNLILLTSSMQAQLILTPDTVHNHFAGVPFDQNFTLKIKDPLQTIDTVSLWSLIIRNGEIKEKTRFFKSKEISKVHTRHLGDFAYSDIPALNPDRYFEVILEHKFRGKALDSLLSVYTKFSIGSKDRISAFNAMSKNIEPLNPAQERRTAIGRYWYTAYEGRVPVIDTTKVDNYYNTKIKPHFEDAIDLKKTPIVTTPNLTEANLQLANNQYKKIDKSFDAYSVYYGAIRNPNSKTIFTGISSISIIPESIKPFHLAKRVEHLEASLKVIDKLISSTYEVLLLDNMNSDTYNKMILDFKTLRKQLYKNKEFIESKTKAITKALDEEKNMRYTTWFSGTNEIRNLKTKGSYFIIPNIGLAALITPKNQNNFLRPFVGVSVHLRQVNKQVPMRYLEKSLLHRLAFNVGLTIIKIEDDSNEYFDLMEKMSLITGINFKISHAIGISGGTVLMKRADPNPLITKRQLVANAYIAFIIDIDFANSMQSLTKKIGF